MLVQKSIIWILLFAELAQGEAEIEQSRNVTDTCKGLKKTSYSAWTAWSVCQGGTKTRRRRCLCRRICGDSLRVEVAGCHTSRSEKQNITHIHYTEQHRRKRIKMTHLRQMDYDVQRPVRGLSQWGPWSPCSRKCTTVRERYCQKWVMCGRRVIRQSAYCYIDGGFCHHWYLERMQRRKDAGNTTAEPMSSRIQAIQPVDSRAMKTNPTCGRVGKYRGSPNAQMRARMRDMMKIIGGRQAPPGKWIWQVAVLNRYKEAFCGGTLVSLRWVVTAAHCVRRKLYVRLGEHDLFIRNYGEVEMRVAEVVIHPQYDPDTVVNDVALLKLPAPARPDLGHGIACLPEPHQILPPHTTCVILGWGKKRATDVHGTRILHEAQVSTIQQGICRRSYWQYAITDNMVCAGRGRRDSCAGDSGGPLLCRENNRSMRYILQGITSFGDGCGKRGKYGIYTRTAGYVTWMHEVMNRTYYD